MGKQDTEWKISIKNEDDLFADKHKPGKVGKIFRGVFVCVFIVVAGLVGYKILIGGEKNTFENYLKNDKYEEALNCYDYTKDFDILVEEIIDRRTEYEGSKSKEAFDRMWKLIFQFESNIRVSEKAFYEDLKLFPKEEKVIRIGYEKNIEERMYYMEEYYESTLTNEFYDDNELYNYYVDVELLLVDDVGNVSEDIDLTITNKGYGVINNTESHVKKFTEIFVEEYIEDGEDELLY